MKNFECPKSIEIMKKINAWNIRCLVDELFVPTTQHITLKIVGFFVCNHNITHAKSEFFNEIINATSKGIWTLYA